MGADEIVDWMAFYVSNSTEFIKKIEKIPVAYSSADDEATAMISMLTGLKK